MTREEILKRAYSFQGANREFSQELPPIIEGVLDIAEQGQNVQSDWNQDDNAKPDYIKNKPTIPAAQIQSDWNQSDNTAADYIKNKPNINLGALLVYTYYNGDGQCVVSTTVSGNPTFDEACAAYKSGVPVIFVLDRNDYIHYMSPLKYVELEDGSQKFFTIDFGEEMGEIQVAYVDS